MLDSDVASRRGNGGHDAEIEGDDWDGCTAAGAITFGPAIAAIFNKASGWIHASSTATCPRKTTGSSGSDNTGVSKPPR
ncbi:hypothetical protein GCM10009854_28830 [Saccharopolyspora halophila]|uniref:Uncharacterized protein n=1 Tax=Saccharopolyspora halophila TaxID=405551 RepID=A0ABN3GE00_9PSEU